MLLRKVITAQKAMIEVRTVANRNNERDAPVGSGVKDVHRSKAAEGSVVSGNGGAAADNVNTQLFGHAAGNNGAKGA